MLLCRILTFTAFDNLFLSYIRWREIKLLKENEYAGHESINF